MDFMKYDYYGNYDNGNDDLFSFSINELHKKQKEKEKYRTSIYKDIASRCFRKIKETSLNEETYCFFNIPEYSPGYPIDNMTECVMFILNMLREKGFSARYVDGFIIYISWHLPKPALKLIEEPKREVKRDILDDLDLKYRPIENYNAFSNFIPKKKF